jgi:GTP-binding protein Era
VRNNELAESRATRCGYVAIIGRPNVGKSTLLNALVGAKISIVANKPQTTWHNIRGILTEKRTQVIFVDTPGIHLGKGRRLNKVLNKNARLALTGVELILFLVDNRPWGAEDDYILNLVTMAKKACLLVVNKTDLWRSKTEILPVLRQFSSKHSFDGTVPISAQCGDNLDPLKHEIRRRMPLSAYHYPQAQLSDRNERFLVTELIREQVVRCMEDELPYSVYVELEKYREKSDRVSIYAIVWVARAGQRSIVIGKQGAMLKRIGIRARNSIEEFLEKKVYLELWVKAKIDWQNDPRVVSLFDSMDYLR